MAESEHQSACSEDNSSVCDEERARKLFQACDGDGDGYIDSQDLLYMCRELSLEGCSVEELMRELGADAEGRISCDAFLRCRLALRSQIDAHLRIAPPPLPPPLPPESYLPTSSDNSLGGKHDTWEFDSGARDLSPEPHTLQRLVEAAAGVNALSTTSTANLLQLANKLHLAALASLRGEILDLSTRLHTVTEERDLLEKTLAETQASIEASSVQHYEERITELHSVIAELTRKIERQRTLVIAEEEDHEQSETEVLSMGSCHDFAGKEKSEEHVQRTKEVDGAATDYEEEEEDEEKGGEGEEEDLAATTTCAGDSPSLSWVHKKISAESNLANGESSKACGSLANDALLQCTSVRSAADGKLLHLAETVSQLETTNADLQLKVSVKEDEIRRLQQLLCAAEEQQQQRKKRPSSGGRSRERPNTKVRESRRTRSARDQALATGLAAAAAAAGAGASAAAGFGVLPPGGSSSQLSSPSPPVPKVAERVRLRRMDRHVTGSDIASFGVSHTEVAEHLVSSLQEQCDLLEMGSDLRKFEIETEKLTSRLEHTRALNTLLQITLEETKSHCERLTQLVGKYESNVVALQLALGCCDRMIDAYQDLLESLSKESNQKTEKEKDDLKTVIEELRRERTTIEGTVVQLESYYEQPSQALLSCSPARARKLDLETAVLMQEVMSMREEKADLNASVYQLEKEKEALELKLAAVFESQQQQQQQHAQSGQATVQHLRTLKEATCFENKCGERDSGSRDSHSRTRSKHSADRSADRLSHNPDLRHRNHTETELQASNSMVPHNLEKTKPKPQRLEAHVLDRVGRHSQVQTFKQRFAQMFDSSRNSSSHGSS